MCKELEFDIWTAKSVDSHLSLSYTYIMRGVRGHAWGQRSLFPRN